MKKFLALLLALTVLLLAGCSGQTPAETTPATTAPAVTEAVTEPAGTEPAETEPTETEPPVPETAEGMVRADKTAVVLTTVNRGDVLDVVDEYDENHYVVKLENGYGLMEKRLARLEGEEPYAAWDGYAKYEAVLHSDYTLRDPEAKALGLNTKVLVLDSLGGVLVVQLGDAIGYVDEEQISSYYIQPYSGGGGGGADGGDISLGFQGGITKLSVFVPQSGEVSGKATVLCDGAEVLLGWFDRAETVQLVTEAGFAEEREGFATVYVNGLYGYIRQRFLLGEGEELSDPTTGYARYGAKLYTSYHMTGEKITLNANAPLEILADLGDCYQVRSGDVTGYMAKDTVSDYPIVYSGGGGGGGEWTPPAM